jgi:rSAM/selenodomain-associated transferase 1
MVKTSKKGAIAIFTKTPGLSPIKTRLAATISKEKAEEFFCICLKIIEKIVAKAQKMLDHTLIPYWAVAEKEGLASPLWKNFSVIYTQDGGLGSRLDHVYSTLIKNHSYVILIGVDCPLLTSEIIIEGINIIKQTNQFVIGPAHDGGFYLFAGNKPIPKDVWQNVTYSTATTLTKLTEKISKFNGIKFLKLLSDVDTFADLINIKKEMAKAKKLLPQQEKLKVWLEQF